MDKIDLHNDLLNYLLIDSQRTPYDEGLKCSISQMIKGEIRTQILAAFSLTPSDPRSLSIQFARYLKLRSCRESLAKQIQFLWAIEDAQQLTGDSPLGKTVEDKIQNFLRSNNAPVYVSLTWIHENEFGGGDRTNVGLKPQGSQLLEALAATNTTIDLSHASDRLAYDIINYREKKGHQNGLIISHTNFRSVHNVPRNVSDEIARYILKVNGLIGLSFSKSQLGIRDRLNTEEHFGYALSLDKKFEEVLCLGGDIYHQEDVPQALRKATSNFYPELSQSGDYITLNALSPNFLFANAHRYLKRNNFIAAD